MDCGWCAPDRDAVEGWEPLHDGDLALLVVRRDRRGKIRKAIAVDGDAGLSRLWTSTNDGPGVRSGAASRWTSMASFIRGRCASIDLAGEWHP
jgi:hypothetical protein